VLSLSAELAVRQNIKIVVTGGVARERATSLPGRPGDCDFQATGAQHCRESGSNAPALSPQHRKAAHLGLRPSDWVADADLAVGQNVGVETAAVNQVLDDARPGQLLQMQAWLAQLDAETLDVPDPEMLAYQVV